MRAVDIIEKKKNGQALSKEEISFFIQGYTNDIIPDYQMSALLMAIYFQGMNTDETTNLTMSFVNSGDVIDLSDIKNKTVDKHSTGGVGDKISLIVIPLVSLAGVTVAKLSGRGLGHTGGTIDKLETIDGFNVEISNKTFIENVNNYNMSISGQSANLTPADKKIYSLRDVTGTVDSIPLIASSIMSKKIASGTDSIVLDVKVGKGAFMKTIEEARQLARTMVNIGKSLNKKTIAVLTNMNQPLGYEVGNANEIKEAIRVLQGQGAEDERVIALTIASYMCILGGVYEDFDTAYKELEDKIKSGAAIENFKKFIKIHGGDDKTVEDPNRLPKSDKDFEIKSTESGYIESIDAELVGLTTMLLGAGRRNKGDKIDYSAGITLRKKMGDTITEGETLAILHTNYEDFDQAIDTMRKAFTISKLKPKKEKYIYDVIM